MGYVLSFPIARLPSEYFLFEPPDTLKRLYPVGLILAVIVLPFWSFTAVREYKPLPILGFIVFLIIILIGLTPTITL